MNFRQSYGNSGELFLLVLDEAQVLLEEHEFRELSRIKYLILRSFKKVISLGATLPQNFATLMEEKLLSPKLYNAVVSEPNRNVYIESKFVSDDEKRVGCLVGVVERFLESYSEGIIFVYFSCLATLREFGDIFPNSVSISSETSDIALAHKQISRTRIILATKAASVGLDISKIRQIGNGSGSYSSHR